MGWASAQTTQTPASPHWNCSPLSRVPGSQLHKLIPTWSFKSLQFAAVHPERESLQFRLCFPAPQRLMWLKAPWEQQHCPERGILDACSYVNTGKALQGCNQISISSNASPMGFRVTQAKLQHTTGANACNPSWQKPSQALRAKSQTSIASSAFRWYFRIASIIPHSFKNLPFFLGLLGAHNTAWSAELEVPYAAHRCTSTVDRKYRITWIRSVESQEASSAVVFPLAQDIHLLFFT